MSSRPIFAAKNAVDRVQHKGCYLHLLITSSSFVSRSWPDRAGLISALRLGPQPNKQDRRMMPNHDLILWRRLPATAKRSATTAFLEWS